MRVAVVSPETMHHRDADDTRRLQALLDGLSDLGHDVTVCTARWWDETGRPDATAATESTDGPNPEGPQPDGPQSGGQQPDGARPDGAKPDGSAIEDPAYADPDDLPPAGAPEQDPVSERSDGGATAGDPPARVEVDGVSYRAVVDDPSEVSSFVRRAPLSIRKARPDVIHAVAAPPSTVVAARLGGSLARAPVLAEWYDPGRSDPTDWTTRQALSRARRIVTPSRLTRRQLLEIGADDAKLRVVPNATDVEQIRSIDPGDGGDVVYARRLDEEANLESLLLGLAELRKRGWSATVIGDGPARDTYEQQARDLRIDDRITFAGACDREERIAIYRDAHAFVQTARRSVFATELLWALACGCVGIVEYHANSSAHELVEGRERGFRTTNPQETAQAIRDAGDLEQLTVDDSYASFDREAVLDQYVACYEALVEDWGWF